MLTKYYNNDNIYCEKRCYIMESLSSAISVQVDSQDKEVANMILKNLGLNMSTFVNMAIKQLIYTDGLPFEVKINRNKDLYESLQESQTIINELKNGDRKGYTNMNDLIKSLNDE